MKTANVVLIVLILGLASFAVAQETTLQLKNPSFEEPVLTREAGMFKDWNTNSLKGTGTWPVTRANAEGEADGNQVAVIHADGYIGQVVHDAAGQPVRIVPGRIYKITFTNLPHNEMKSTNMGIYLLSGNKDGGRVAEAIPFKKNLSGEQEITMTIWPAAQLAKSAADWQAQPLYLMFRNFVGRMVIDNVRIEQVN